MRLCVNGIDVATGRYLLPPAEVENAKAVASGGLPPRDLAGWLRGVARQMREEHLGLPAWVDPSDPASVGWGIVFSTEEPLATRAALEPLIEHRRRSYGEVAVKVLEHR